MAKNFKKIVPRSASPPGDYDINGAFRVIEQELISSMKRNWQKHNMDKRAEGFTWSRWQAEYLRGFEEFKAENKDKFKDDFKEINKNFLDQITLQHETNFFGVNKRRMEALIKSSTHDLKKAEHAVLRRCNDQYRKTMFNAQAYMNSGAGTLKQAIDMANRDFLKNGINCVRYKDGKTVNIASYAEMSLRTATTRATLLADGNFRNEMGVHTVKVSSYGACSKLCQPWQGRVYVDDVYSGGTAKEAEELHLPLLSTAIQGGLFHPNCRHHLSTYYPGTQNDDGDPRQPTYENPPGTQEHHYLQNQIQRERRLIAGSLDENNIREHKQKEQRLIREDEKYQKLLIQYSYNDLEKLIEQLKLNMFKISNISEDISKKQMNIILEKMNFNKSFEIAHVPDILQSLGIKVDKIILTRENLAYILSRHAKNMTINDYRNLKDTIENYDLLLYGDGRTGKNDFKFYKLYEDDDGVTGLDVVIAQVDSNSELIIHANHIGKTKHKAEKLYRFLSKSDRLIDKRK